MQSTDLVFPSGSESCHGTLRMPDTPHCGAGVVLAHGFGGTADCASLISTATRLTESGLVTLAFDYRSFGLSGGEPRQAMSAEGQRQDYQAAVSHLRSLNLVAADRIGLWGTSFSGGHTLFVARDDAGIGACVAQVPALDMKRSHDQIAQHRSTEQTARMMATPPDDLIKLVIEAHDDVALFMSEQSVLFRTAEALHAGSWVNGVLASSVLSGDLGTNDPSSLIDRVSTPTLVQVAARDELNSTPGSLDYAKRFDAIELLSYDCRHFEIYSNGYHDDATRDASAFFLEHL
jgi:fermentation-respiration switch protein FrsA (DUF1100 family)